MGWIRANRRVGGVVALLALAFQILVALGHVHIQPSAFRPALNIAADFDGVLPSEKDAPQQKTDASCDICAVLHMASAAQVAAPPSVALPVARVSTRDAVIGDLAISSPRRILAQSRAPPIV